MTIPPIDADANPLDRYAEATKLLHEFAPELGIQPLYVLPRPAIYPQNCWSSAFALLYGCPIIRQTLIEADAWRGPGPMIIIEDSTLGGADLLGTLIHEAAHILPSKVVSDWEPSAAGMVAAFRHVEKWAADPGLAIPASGEPWAPMHGLDFIRRILHLHKRAWLAGHEVTGKSLSIAGEHYGLSPAIHYFNALGDEPARMQHLLFEEIEAIDPPRAFTRLFDEDVTRWREEHTSELEEGSLAAIT